jgi:hypothetical protein
MVKKGDIVMGNFEFKSQVATTKEQSERLLALSLKKETADMYYDLLSHITEVPYTEVELQRALGRNDVIPAWSLHRLIELMPEVIFDALLCVFKDSIRYEALVFDRIEVLNDVVSDNIYDNAIATIEWLIKEGYFNTDYLDEK